ncbi:hypothetical protein DFH06DRAFT_723085 [Mycena polygramma]|nr:hypothetical protein DFH06DRAFT_723085 [Mycena polygramma]
MMFSLLAHPESDTVLSLLSSFGMLERLLTTTIPVGHRGFPDALDALDAGLLRLLARCTREFAQELDSTLRLFLTKLLPDSLVYYHAVAAVANALDEVGVLECKTLSPDWAAFIELAQIRVDIMNDLYAYMVSIKTCDNIECAKIRRRSRFRRCSGCKSFYYCSRECQTVDWKRGGHREHCASYTTLTLAESKSCPLDFKERHFMRALAQSYYQDGVYELHEQQVVIMAKDAPHGGVVITLLDFTHNPVQISIQPFPDSPLANYLDELGAEWSNIVARAVSSRGRLHLHVMLVPQSTKQRFWVVPLRTNNSRIHDELLHLAMNLPGGWDEDYIADEVDKIRDREIPESEELMEVH